MIGIGVRAALIATTILTAPAYGAVIVSDRDDVILGTDGNDVVFSYSPANVIVVGGPKNDSLSGGINHTIQRFYCDEGPNGERAGNPGTQDVANLGPFDVAVDCEFYVMHGFHYGEGAHARIDTFRLDVSKVVFPISLVNSVILSNTTTINRVQIDPNRYRTTVTGLMFSIPDVPGVDMEGVGQRVLVKLKDPITVIVNQGETATWHPTIQALKAKIIMPETMLP